MVNLEIKNLTKIYRDKVVLNDISLESFSLSLVRLDVEKLLY